MNCVNKMSFPNQIISDKKYDNYERLKVICEQLKTHSQHQSNLLQYYKSKYKQYKSKSNKLQYELDHQACELHDTKISFIFYQVLSVLIYIGLAILLFLKSH